MGNEHLSADMILKLKKGDLSPEKMIEALEHIGACSACAGLLADSYEEKDLLRVPPQFAEGVLRRTGGLRLTAPAVKENKGTRDKAGPVNWKREFHRYTLKVACAASAILLLLGTGAFGGSLENIASGKLIHYDFSGMNAIPQSLNDFSSRLLNWEVINND